MTCELKVSFTVNQAVGSAGAITISALVWRDFGGASFTGEARLISDAFQAIGLPTRP
jgi:hypothetical protein